MRNDIMERKEDILKWIEEHQPKAYMCRELKCKPETLERYLGLMEISYSGNQGLQGFRVIDNNYVLAIDYIKNPATVKSSILKDKLIKEGIKEDKCESCGLTYWLNQKISLELHHIDGNHYNNDFDNLQILCPNCHSLTQNYCNKAVDKPLKIYEESKEKIKEKTNTCICCNKLISNKATYCSSCWQKQQQRVERPPREQFKQEIRNQSFLSLGQKYGVSNKSISKWCIAYNLPYKKSDIKQYSDEEWEKI